MRKFLIFTLLALPMAGCLKTNLNDKSTTQSSGGIYQGTLNNPATSKTDIIFALIDENGSAVLIDQTSPAILTFNIAVDSNDNFTSGYTSFSGSGLGISNGAGTTAGNSISGSVSPRSSITGTITPSGGAGAAFTLNYNAEDYENPVAATVPNGTYVFQYTDSTVTPAVTKTATLTFNNGAITGSDNSGACNFTGTVTTPSNNYNGYDLSLTGACSGTAFTRSGLAEYNPASGGNTANLTLEYNDGSGFAIAGNAPLQ
ncbi:MAG: hypothetical protein ACRETW_08085 [Stenotrophobium sp.]